jgi:hypothetical protein
MCSSDNQTAGSGAALDLADDDSDESSQITEIATTGDTNNVITESSPDKMLIDFSQNWPSADAASNLSANGNNCAGGSFPLGVDASGNAESCTDAATQAELDSHESDITDVHNINIATPADAHFLIYDGGGDNRFENKAISGDVSITNAGVSTVSDDSHNHTSVSASDGTVTFSGTGGANNEDLTYDFETVANEVGITSSTGVTTVNMDTLDLKVDTIESTASSTDGGAITFCEDTDVGTDCVEFTVGQTDLPGGTTTHTINSNGRIPDSAVGNGSDDTGTEVVYMHYGCNDTDAADGTTYMFESSETNACNDSENSGGNDFRNITRLPYAGAVNGLTCTVETAPGAGDTVTLTVRFEGSDTDCAVAISNTDTIGTDTTCSTAYTATNYITISHVTSVGSVDVDQTDCHLLMEVTVP